jgi:hypothetical protein
MSWAELASLKSTMICAAKDVHLLVRRVAPGPIKKDLCFGGGSASVRLTVLLARLFEDLIASVKSLSLGPQPEIIVVHLGNTR